MDERIEWIDIAKGLGILIVIAGHTVSLRYSYPLYAFHMPLFFFLSGLLFKDRGDGFMTFIKKKAKALLKPWAVMLFISFLVCLAIPQWRNELGIKPILLDFYTANTNTLQNSSLWYLICFFFVLVIFYFVNKLKTKTLRIVFLLSAVAFLWIKEVLDMTSLPLHRLPFKIDSALIAIVFFAVGFWCKDLIISVDVMRIKPIYIILFVLASASLCVLNKWSNINSLDFGRIRLLYYPIAFMGIASVCLISKMLSSINCSTVKSILLFYGKNSLLVFGFQSLFIRLYLLLFNELQGLSMTLYGDNPMIHQVGSFCVVSFVMSPLVVLLFSALRARNVNLL